MKRLMILVISFYIGVVNATEETWVCVPDYTNGFSSFDRGGWKYTKFNTGPEKYLVKVYVDSEDRITGKTMAVGMESPENDNCWGQLILARCDAGVYQLRMNRENGRFTLLQDIGYILSDMPGMTREAHITIGKCSKI
jgi:hypothetical protein